MEFQSMESTSTLFKKALINASNVSRLSEVLLLPLTRFCFESSCQKTILFVEVVSIYCPNMDEL
jgi:hypothetical protein